MAKSDESSKVWKGIVAIALAAAGLSAYLAFGRGEPGAPAGAPNRDESSRQATRLRDAARRLELMRGKMEKTRREALEKAREGDEPNEGAAELTGQEETALKEAVARIYNPDAMAKVFSSDDPRAGADYAEEIDRSFRETVTPSGLALGGKQMPMTPGLEKALRDVDVLRRYATNLMHAHMPGNPDGQKQMVDRLNDRYREKLRVLGEQYPFLDAAPFELP